MIILGCDPGLAHAGCCIVRLGPTSEVVLHAEVIVTEKSAKKLNTLASCDDTERCRALSSALDNLIGEWDPQALCIEAASWPRNASAAAKTGMARGIIASIAQRRGLPILQASPQAVKKAVCGKRDASKEEVQAAVCKRYPEMTGILAKMRKMDREHAADSVGAVVACLESDVVRMLRGAGR